MFDTTEMFMQQLQKLYHFRCSPYENVYVQFLHSLPKRERDNFHQFMAIYLKKANLEIEDITTSALGLACLQFAMEYYFL